MNSKHPLVYFPWAPDYSVMGLFYKLGYRGTKDISIADVLVFTGGADIESKLYEEKQLPTTNTNPERDVVECAAFRAAKNWGIPMIGICRGAQLLNVLSGGKLWQHVESHRTMHYATDLVTGDFGHVSSTHHQQMIAGPGAVVVGVASDLNGKTLQVSSLKQNAEGSFNRSLDSGERDMEVLWYPETKCLCFQPHPEHPYPIYTREWFENLHDRYIESIIKQRDEAA